MIARRSPCVKLVHCVISSNVRLQPTHKSESGSTVQIFMQGVSMGWKCCGIVGLSQRNIAQSIALGGDASRTTNTLLFCVTKLSNRIAPLMPNCDFYATIEDHEPLLDWLFAERTCLVYELSSDDAQPIKRFSSAKGVLSQFERRYPNGQPWNCVTLNLYVNGSCAEFVPFETIEIPFCHSGAIRKQHAEGWGLVQLYLSSVTDKGLDNSHTNHGTLAWAEKWAPHNSRQAPPSAWDFKRVAAFSSRLNREIRKMSVDKLASRPILPGAAALRANGVKLLPYG
jgi:hypothetical protein